MTPPEGSVEEILSRLNPSQRDAVTATEGPLLVIAGAGSGKTRVITHRIAYLVRERGVQPWQVFAATFTNKAAEEMRARIRAMLPGYETARLTIGTFHSICVSILRREADQAGLTDRFSIADESDQTALIKDCLRELDLPASRVKPEDAKNWIGRAKTMMVSPARAALAFGVGGDPVPQPGDLYSVDEIRQSLWIDTVRDHLRLYQLYEERLLKNNAVDFDDIIIKVVGLFRESAESLARCHERWKYFLVDEYQDTNRVQAELMRLLASREKNLCVVGDEDQSIYSWRGAEIENILRFPEEHPGSRIIRLEQNYRSTETILQAAGAVIEHNRNRHGKRLWSDRGAGEPIVALTAQDERSEAADVVASIRRLHGMFGIPYKDMAIFYRMNALSRLFEDFLREMKIAYRVVGGVRFYDRAEIKDLLAYMRAVANPLDGLSLSRIVNKPRRGIGDKTMTKVFSDAARRGVSIIEQLAEAARDEEIPAKARGGMIGLLDGLARWRQKAQTISPAKLLELIINETDYEASLGDSDKMETLSRIENIGELRRAVEEWVEANPGGTLDQYLEVVSLTQAQDAMAEDEDCVSLMTLHSAKGLEFPVVFLTGLEEGLFPSARSVADGRSLEEERRLFYVGVTRAMDRLIFSRADRRSLYGRTAYNPPSVFWHETPPELMVSFEIARGYWAGGRAIPAAAEDRTLRRPVGKARASQLADVDPPAPEEVFDEGSGAEPDIDEHAEEIPFPPGARIRHPRLGEGQVIKVVGEGDRRKISIRFDAGLEMEILERYGGIERVEELPF